MTDVMTPTPSWWPGFAALVGQPPAGAETASAIRDRLFKKLIARQPAMAELDNYYRGEHPLPLAIETVAQSFRRMMLDARANWCELVVDATAERLKVAGFRFADKEVGQEAWRLWQGNSLDADSGLVHVDALVCRRSFALVWPDETSTVGVTITAEDPAQCIVEYEPGSRRKRTAALKAWLGNDGTAFATLYLPDEVWKWTTDGKADLNSTSLQWITREVNDETWPITNPLGRVPVVEFTPRPRTRGEPMSELDGGVIPTQRRINKTLLDRMLASEYGAFRQRWMTGYDLEVDENTGKAKAPFVAAIDRLWVAEDEDVKFGEFEQTDLKGYLESVEQDVLHLAAITKTPPHYLLGKMVNTSGDALKAAEAGLVSKVKDRMTYLGESWEDVMRLALRASGGPDTDDDVEAEVIWADPETRSESELVDSLVKKRTIGVPNAQLWEDASYSPQQIERFKVMRQEEALVAALAAPIVAPPTAPAQLEPAPDDLEP